MIGLRIHPTDRDCITNFFDMQYPICDFAQIRRKSPDIDRNFLRLQEKSGGYDALWRRKGGAAILTQIERFPSFFLHVSREFPER